VPAERRLVSEHLEKRLRLVYIGWSESLDQSPGWVPSANERRQLPKWRGAGSNADGQSGRRRQLERTVVSWIASADGEPEWSALEAVLEVTMRVRLQ
jgi:hypothetical protein